MSIFRKGSKLEREELEREAQRKAEREAEAEALHRRTMETVESGLRVKREVRERAARFIGSLQRSPGYSNKPT